MSANCASTFSQTFWVAVTVSNEFLWLFWRHMNPLSLMSVWNWMIWMFLICKWSRTCSRSLSRLDAEVRACCSVFVLLCKAKGTKLWLKKWCQHHYVATGSSGRCGFELDKHWHRHTSLQLSLSLSLVSLHAINTKQIELTWQSDLFKMLLGQYLIPVGSGSKSNKTM